MMPSHALKKQSVSLPPPPAAGPNPIEDLLRPRPVQASASPVWRRHRLGRADCILAAALFCIALLARWPFIAQGHTLLHSDEAIVGIMSQDIRDGARYPMFFYGQRYMGALEAYVIAALRPLCADAITALRLGPACFFAALTVLQYLMLTRWFGRKGGLMGAATLLAASPMFVQWSISARGGYVEVLVWGTALWWCYSEWFVDRLNEAAAGTHPTPLHKGVLGFLIGSGLWINPTIAVFVVPIVVHALMNRPLAAARRAGRASRFLAQVDTLFPVTPMALPFVGLVAVFLVTGIWAVWVEDGRVRHAVLMSLIPRPAAFAVLSVLALLCVLSVARSASAVAWLRGGVQSGGPMILGALIGLVPTGAYVAQRALAGEPMEASLPLGLRPLATVGETLIYLMNGLPLLFGPDARPFLDLVRIGRAYPTTPLNDMTGAAVGRLNLLVLGAMIAASIVLIRQYGREIASMLRLKAGPHSPVAFLVLALLTIPAMYCMGGCTIDFTTIRYLLPLWAVVPGLVAAMAISRRDRAPATACAGVLLAAWGAGQIAFHAQLGAPHPLEKVAAELRHKPVQFALAEPLDAHLLSFLTGQQPPIGEYQSFWPRLGHYREGRGNDGPVTYLVDTNETDWTRDWLAAQWPGSPPPETSRYVWPLVRQTIRERPEELVSREPVAEGYVLVTLRHALPEQQSTP